MNPEKIELTLPDSITLRGLRWNPGAPVKVLALHGWLDNAHSFLPLARLLPDQIELLAIDQAGHGWSDHRSGHSWYYLADFVRDIDQLTSVLNWNRFSLLGHSLGGAVSCMTAAALAEQVQALAVVEGLGPLPGDPQQSAGRLGEALAGLKQAAKTRLRQHPSPDAAAAARLKTNPMQPASAELLVKRGLQQTDDGWVWRTDTRLRVASPVRFTEIEIQYMLEGIKCPVLQVMPDPPAAFMSIPHMQRRRAMISDYRQIDIPGHHHVHMDNPEPCAAAIFPFLIEHQDANS